MLNLCNYERLVKKTLLEIRPDFKEFGQGYFYKGFPMWPRCFYMREIVPHMLILNRQDKIKVADYGCGAGIFLLYLWLYGFGRNSNNLLEGYDCDGTKIQLCAELFDRLDVPARFEVGDICDIRGTYDLITAYDFIYEANLDIKSVFSSVKGALNNRGLFSFTTFGSEITQKNRNYFTLEELREFCKETEFEIILELVRSTSNNTMFFFVVRKVR